MNQSTEEHATSVASLIFLIFLIVGGFAIAFLSLPGPLTWCIGMIAGFLFGVFAAIEFQSDKEKVSKHD